MSGTANLSARDAELRGLLIGTCEDLANIAFRMGITHGTAKVYSIRLYLKLGVSGRVELMHREIERLKEGK